MALRLRHLRSALQRGRARMALRLRHLWPAVQRGRARMALRLRHLRSALQRGRARMALRLRHLRSALQRGRVLMALHPRPRRLVPGVIRPPVQFLCRAGHAPQTPRVARAALCRLRTRASRAALSLLSLPLPSLPISRPVRPPAVLAPAPRPTSRLPASARARASTRRRRPGLLQRWQPRLVPAAARVRRHPPLPVPRLAPPVAGKLVPPARVRQRLRSPPPRASATRAGVPRPSKAAPRLPMAMRARGRTSPALAAPPLLARAPPQGPPVQVALPQLVPQGRPPLPRALLRGSLHPRATVAAAPAARPQQPALLRPPPRTVPPRRSPQLPRGRAPRPRPCGRARGLPAAALRPCGAAPRLWTATAWGA